MAGLVLTLGLGACSGEAAPVHVVESPATGGPSPSGVAPKGGLTFERASGPARTIVKDAGGAVVATFTDDARTVVFSGPERTFEEPTATDAVVTTTSWVRLAPRAWSEGAEDAAWFAGWFDKMLGSTSPDVFEVAFQYVKGAPPKSDKDGIRYRGDASFGPVAASGESRLEANDFYDYLGVSWTFPDVGRERPEKRRYGSLDCSGFMRMVLGYRLGLPLRGSNEAGPGLPRRAYAIEAYGPGIEVVPNRKRTATDYDALQPGDLLFFEVDGGGVIDHMGIYLGLDSDGHHRFLSSRDRANGPTMGDIGGTSLLDDGAFYSRGWYAARRV